VRPEAVVTKSVYLPGYNALQSFESQLTFRRHMSAHFKGRILSKARNQPASREVDSSKSQCQTETDSQSISVSWSRDICNCYKVTVSVLLGRPCLKGG
jgi:hypothetical protein